MQKHTISPEELRRATLFSALDDDQLGRILETSHLIKLDEGQHLFECQQEAHFFFILRSGALRLFLSTPDGNEKVIHLISPGETFAEAITFMEGQRYPVSADALCKSEVISFSNSTFRDVLRESTDSCFRMMANMSNWLKRQLNDIYALTLQNASLRFSNFLLQHAPPGQRHDVRIELTAPKHVIASRLSIQPESLSRIFRNMQDSGLIQVDVIVSICPDTERLTVHNRPKES